MQGTDEPVALSTLMVHTASDDFVLSQFTGFSRMPAARWPSPASVIGIDLQKISILSSSQSSLLLMTLMFRVMRRPQCQQWLHRPEHQVRE